MKYYVGLDVSVEKTAIRVIDETGKIVRETSAVSHADDLIVALEGFRGNTEAIGLEAGPMSEFLAGGLKSCGLNAILMETRRVHAALSAIPVKTDRKDARGIAELLRMGWFQPVHMKTSVGRDLRLLLSARETLGRRIRELDNSVRGLLRGFGLRIPTGARNRFCSLVRELIVDNPTLVEAITPLLKVRDCLAVEFSKLDKAVRDRSRSDAVCRRLMTVPGVGQNNRDVFDPRWSLGKIAPFQSSTLSSR